MPWSTRACSVTAVTDMRRYRLSVVLSVAWLLLVALATLTATWLPIEDPNKQSLLNMLAAPSISRWFGADSLGRDVFSRTIHGFRISLAVSFGAASVGLVFGGAQLARAAAIAHAKLARGEGDADFMRAKIATARHFADHLLTQAPGLRTAVLTTTASGVGSLPPLVVTLTGYGAGPTITCPQDIITANDPGQCGAVVHYPPPIPSEGTATPVVSVPPSGSFFPLGTTTVTCTSESGAVCSFDVTVNDVDAPVIGNPSASPALTDTSS